MSEGTGTSAHGGHLGPRGWLASFSRSQIAALIATGADFALLFVLVEFFRVWYVAATAIGALVGAIVNFSLNRYWSFRAHHRAWHGQAVKYALVSGGSLVLNTYGVYAATEGLHLHYAASVFLVSMAVAVAYNFPLQRCFVFHHGTHRHASGVKPIGGCASGKPGGALQ